LGYQYPVLIVGMQTQSFEIGEDWITEVENRLVYGQSKSAWYRHAVMTTIAVDKRLDGEFAVTDYEDRREFVLEAVGEKIERECDETD